MRSFCFDIETVPDVDFGRQYYDLDGLPEDDIATAMTFLRKQSAGTDFLPLHQHRIVAISVAFRNADRFRVWSLGDRDADEAEIVQRFFDGIDKYTPDLVSWNGGGFDLPVLHYRALKHGIRAPRYWEAGDGDRDFKWNNYQSRYHRRHTDVMDVLANYNNRAFAKLDEIAVMLGFPGKLGMSGANVQEAFQAGRIDDIRNYCETDVLNTWLVYLRLELMRGRFDEADMEREYSLVRSTLASMDEPHLNEFLSAWQPIA